jgi:hypothetical protein
MGGAGGADRPGEVGKGKGPAPRGLLGPVEDEAALGVQAGEQGRRQHQHPVPPPLPSRGHHQVPPACPCRPVVQGGIAREGLRHVARPRQVGRLSRMAPARIVHWRADAGSSCSLHLEEAERGHLRAADAVASQFSAPDYTRAGPGEERKFAQLMSRTSSS